MATRLVTVAVFVLAADQRRVRPATWPTSTTRAGCDEVRRIYAAATGWVVRLSLPAFVALLVFPDELLRLFGPDFAAGAAVTVILALGQLVNAATGPCGTLLNMSGRVALNMADNLAALVLNVLLNLWLIPAYGIVGAAVAWAVSLAAVNVPGSCRCASLVQACRSPRAWSRGCSPGWWRWAPGSWCGRWCRAGWQPWSSAWS